MSYPEPSKTGYTIFSKSGCTYCDQVKELLKEENKEFIMYNCDVFLEKDKPAFLDYIKQKAGKEYKTFPMVFLDGAFIGGFMDTYKILLKEDDSE